MWAEQVRHLSDRFHCVTIDLPGNGASHEVPWRSFDDSAAAVAAVIAATPAGHAHVVGLSLGGYVAITLIARHPADRTGGRPRPAGVPDVAHRLHRGADRIWS